MAVRKGLSGWVAVSLIAVAIGAIAAVTKPGGTGSGDATPVAPARANPEPPNFSATTLDGKEVSLSAYKGRVVLIDFWATWCAPCIAEVPHVKRAYAKFHDQGFEVIGVSLDDDRDRLTRFLAREEMTWPQILNADMTAGADPATLYGVRAIPTTILVGRDGRIAATNLRGEQLLKEVERSLKAPLSTDARGEGAGANATTPVPLTIDIGRPRGPERAGLGVLDQPAPAWEVDRWFNLPTEKASLDIADYRGKVVYLYGFQSWCPGCHSRGFPTLQKLVGKFQDADDVAFVAVQTTFEGFGTNTADAARKTGERYKLTIPVGHSGSEGKRSELMRAYKTGGTPWTIIIDKDGVVRFNDFHITPEQGEKLITALRSQCQGADASGTVIPKPSPARGGQDVIGSPFPHTAFVRWIKPEDRAGAAGNERPGFTERSSRAALYRWWTDGCPFCESSLPAVESLRKKYEADGLRVVAVYHPKPPRSVPDHEIAAAARRLGYHGDIAVDQDWSVLRRVYLFSAEREATSASLLVDQRGMIRFVHPGPELFPSSEPRDSVANQDYLALDAAIRLQLR